MTESAAAKKKSSKRMMAVSAAAVVLILVIAFGYFVPQLTRPAVTSPKIIAMGTTDYVWGLDPADIRGYMAHMVSKMIFDSLTRLQLTTDGWEARPNLAVRWESTDGKGAVWEFELRRDVLFHDGTPFNATAVKSSMDRLAAGKKGEYDSVTNFVKSVEVVDTYKVRFYTTYPYLQLPFVLGITQSGIASPSAVKKWDADFSTKSLSGTGPFKFERYVSGDEIVVVRNDKYWNKERLPKLDRFILKFYKDPSTMKMALEKKEIDIVHRYLLTSDVPALETNAGIGIYRGMEPFVRFMGLNLRNKYLSNELVRQAIAYAIDYERIAKFRGGQRAYGAIAKNQIIPDIFTEAQKQFVYDPTKAKQLMTQAGYPRGISEPMEMIVDTAAYGAEEIEMATMIKNNLDAVGIPVTMRLVDSVLRMTIINSGNSTLSLFSYVPSVQDADQPIAAHYYSKYPAVTAEKRFGFIRADIDSLVEQARLENDLKKKREILIKIQNITDGVPSHRLFIYRPWNYVFAWKYVKGDLTPFIVQGYAIDWTQIDIDPERKIS